MYVLAIGNSFSQDSTKYLHQIARKNGEKIFIANLYVGACSLEMHYRNMLSEAKAYSLEVNGSSSGFFVSLKEALLSRKWDYISLQQVSHESTKYENYQPYLNELVSYVKKHSPKAKICLHQVWAYEQGSKSLNVNMGYEDQKDMFADTKAAYEKAFAEINPDLLLPSGEVMQEMIMRGFKVHRDTIHADIGKSRYALGLLWYGMLTGKEVENDSFSDLDKEETEECLNEVRQCVSTVIKKYR